MLINILLFVFGFVFLLKGADLLVVGSSSIAKKHGLSNLAIGLTIVAFGTSAPELIVSLLASLKGQADIAMGNIIGSNISNTLLILGIAAVIHPLLVKKTTVTKEIPFSLLAILAVFFLVNDSLLDHAAFNGLTRIDGLILILFFIIFIYYTFGISKVDANLLDNLTAEKIKTYRTSQAALMIAAGIFGLFFGGRWIVAGAVNIARWLRVSQALISLTIVAIGTSLPELAASAVAAYRGETDISIGNIVGSNIFNLFWVLGLSAIIKPIAFDPILNIDILILILSTILLLFLVFLGKKNILGRDEGAILLFLYAGYLAFLLWRGWT